jgi:hypothetical protein
MLRSVAFDPTGILEPSGEQLADSDRLLAPLRGRLVLKRPRSR